MQKVYIFSLFLPICATAATCPSGHISIDKGAHITISPSCTSNQSNVGGATIICGSANTCWPELACDAGFTTLRTNTGVVMPLYANRYTSPSLYIQGTNGTTCYANLQSGASSGAVNVVYNNTTYHTIGLRQCININASTTPTAITPTANTVTWSATTNGVTIKGVAYCGTTTGSIGTTAASVNISNTITNNTKCWCRMTVPATSKWVYSTSYSAATTCDTSCVSACASNFAGNSTFRSAIISTITE